MSKLTVMFATHNGANTLPRVLDAYTRAHAPTCDWEIIVVDNASTDQTGQILEKYASLLPLKAAFEATPGKNRALNTGLPLVTGTAMILTDDDAIPQPDFLQQWEKTFNDRPDVDVFGGSIDLLFEAPLPDWHARSKSHFTELYAYRQDVADGPVEPTEIYGPNMALGSRPVADGIRFDESIGPAAGNAAYAMGSETELCQRLSREGYTLGFSAGPSVSHIVRNHQTTPEFLTRRAYRLGRGAALQQWVAGEIDKTKPGPVRALARALRTRLRRLKLKSATFQSDPLKKFEANWELNFHKGYTDQLHDLRAFGGKA